MTDRQAARRERVLEAAMQLATEGGYDAVQMRDVAARADVALGTLYRYFASKDQLLVECLGAFARELQRGLGTNPPRGASPADRVIDVLRRAMAPLEREPQLASALVTALSSLSSADAAGLEAATGVYGIVGEMITAAMDHEEHPEREAVIRTIGHVWLAALITGVRGREGSDQFDRDLEAAVRLLLPGPERDRRRAVTRVRD